MPRNYLFTREQIVENGLNLVREKGFESLTARSLGERMNSSSKPIFSLFKNMDELKQEIISEADKLYQSYIQNEMNSGKYPPYKASGMAYIHFAKKEKELFKLLFMRNRRNENIKEGAEMKHIIPVIQKNTGLSEKDAKLFHMEMWIYVHGIASMIATDYLDLDEIIVSQMISDIYNGMRIFYSDRNNMTIMEETWKQSKQ